MTHPQERVSLGEAAYRRLHADIVTCRLAPGQRLTERQLVLDTGFGASPLREALTRLDHDGLIRTLPRKGYQVTPLTPKSVDDLFVMWEIVGPEIVRLGLGNATPAQVAELQTVLEQGPWPERASGRDVTLDQVEAAREAFSILCTATTNDYLAALFHRISGDIERVWALIIDGDGGSTPSLDSTDFWREAQLLHREPDEAAEAARHYIEQMHHRVLRIVARWPSVMQSEVAPIRSARACG